jgi:hypothetical protein
LETRASKRFGAFFIGYAEVELTKASRQLDAFFIQIIEGGKR